MSYQPSPSGTCSPLWDSTPIGKSINLCLRQDEYLSPQLILEYKVLHSAIHSQTNSTSRSQVQFIGTLISDDDSQRLTYVIDRLLARDSTTHEINNHQPLTGEFLIPIQYHNKNSSTLNNSLQTGITEINAYCHSSFPIELHRFSYLCSQISFHHSSPINVDLLFHLITIKTSFTLTPINSDSIQIVPTALLMNLNSSIKTNQSHFGYCSLDRTSKNKILFLLENDPQTCVLPLVGIWISGINDIQCAFVWSACLRYCMNSSLKQRLRSGRNPQQSFLLACYLSPSANQCIFYEVNLITKNVMTFDYDLWTCSKQISLPNSSLNQYDPQFPYDFDFKRVDDEQKKNVILGIHSGNTSPSFQSARNNRFPTEIPSDDNQQNILSSPNTNGSLFGVPRLPPKQSIHQSPSWDSLATTTITTPKRIVQPSTTDIRWREELIERMQSYEIHIQSLTALVTQLVDVQKQQNLILTPIKQCTKSDVAVQTEPLSPCRHNHTDESSSNIEQQTSFIDKSSFTQLQSPSGAYEHEPMVDDASPLTFTNLNAVDILKPVFRFINNQQQGSAASSTPICNSTDINNEETENMSHLPNPIQHQQQHVTSTRTTGISFVSNGVQMQIINQESSTTTVYPQSQSALLSPSSTGFVPTSPQKSENNLSVEVHSLEMKYLDDDQLAVAIECDRPTPASSNAIPQTSQIVDKSVSFGTEEYLQRYDLFNASNH